MLKNILKRLRSDKADAILTMSIILVPFFALTAGFAIDLTRASYVKSTYINVTQEAAKEAVKEVNVQGNLTENAPAVFVQRYNSVVTNNGQYGEGFIPRGPCTQVDIDPETGADHEVLKTAPYMEIQLYSNRGDKYDDGSSRAKWTYDPDNGLQSYTDATTEPWRDYYQYKVISVRVWDAIPNTTMGIVGMPCQRIISETNAVTFATFDDENDTFDSTPLPACFDTIYNGTNKVTWAKPYSSTSKYKLEVNSPYGDEIKYQTGDTTSYTNENLATDEKVRITAITPDGNIPSCQGYVGNSPLPECYNTNFDGANTVSWTKPHSTVTGYSATLVGPDGVTSTSTLASNITQYTLATGSKVKIVANTSTSSIQPCSPPADSQGYVGNWDNLTSCFNVAYNDSNKLSWTKPTNAVSDYTVKLKELSTGNVTTSTLAASATSYINNNLASGYKADIIANTTYGAGVKVYSCQGYQGTPAATCFNTTWNSSKITWSAVTGATTYIAFERTPYGTTQIDLGNALSYTNGNLTIDEAAWIKARLSDGSLLPGCQGYQGNG